MFPIDIEVMGHLGFIFVALSFAVRDILWLRVLAISASISLTIYNYFAPQEPLWLVIFWQIIFLVINAVQIFITLRQQNKHKVVNTDITSTTTFPMVINPDDRITHTT